MPGYLKAVEVVRRDGWDDARYPFNVPAVRGLRSLKLHPRCTFFVGENGSGKTTLIEAIAVAMDFAVEGGARDPLFSARDAHSPLHAHVRLLRNQLYFHDGWFLRTESLFTDGAERRNGPEAGGVSRHGQSHGEAMFALLQHRFKGDGLYILDEPEAGLSPARQLSFLTRMHDLIRARSQFIIATHSPIILAYPDAWIYRCGEAGLERIDYADAEPVTVTRNFLNRREASLRVLLADEPGEPKPR